MAWILKVHGGETTAHGGKMVVHVVNTMYKNRTVIHGNIYIS